MAIFTLSPLNGFFGALGSISVHLALLCTMFFCVRPTKTAYEGDLPPPLNWTDENNSLYKQQVSVLPLLTISSSIGVFPCSVTSWLRFRWDWVSVRLRNVTHALQRWSPCPSSFKSVLWSSRLTWSFRAKQKNYTLIRFHQFHPLHSISFSPKNSRLSLCSWS
jgi:hypothetical protein